MHEGSELTVDRPGDETEALGDGGIEELYARHIQGGVRLAYLLTGDRAHAEDLAQEAFIRCVGRFQHLRDRRAFDAYLRRAIVNLHTSSLRRRKLEREWIRTRTVGDGDAQHVDARRRRTCGPVASARLAAARQRAALVLRYYEDLSERDAAEALGCSVAAVKSLVSRGSESLRDLIRGEDR